MIRIGIYAGIDLGSFEYRTHSFIHSLTYSFIYSLTHSLTHNFCLRLSIPPCTSSCIASHGTLFQPAARTIDYYRLSTIDDQFICPADRDDVATRHVFPSTASSAFLISRQSALSTPHSPPAAAPLRLHLSCRAQQRRQQQPQQQ